MIEQVQGYLVLAVCFLLIFFVMAALVEPYKERLVQLFKKNTWKTARKFFYIWMGILVLRKLIYYVSLQGVMQTKLSVWWADNTVLITIYCVSIGILVGMPLIKIIKGIWQSSEEGAALMKILIPLFLFAFFNFISNQRITIGRIFSTIIAAPFLLLKIVCPGKYIGLFTSLVLAYFVIEYHKKIRNRIFISVLILLVLGAYIFLTFPGQWEDRFQQKAQTAKSKRAVEDLLDAVNTINHEEQRSDAIGIIAVKILETGDPQWQRETFPEIIAAVEEIGSRNRKFKLLEKIAFAVAETGDIHWATSIANGIPDQEIKNKALEELREKVEQK